MNIELIQNFLTGFIIGSGVAAAMIVVCTAAVILTARLIAKLAGAA